MMGVTWKGSETVLPSWGGNQLSGACRTGPSIGLRTYASYYFYFAYAPACGRCPAPGFGSPDWFGL